MIKFLNIGVIGLVFATGATTVFAGEVATGNVTPPAVASKARVHVAVARTADVRAHAHSTHHAPVTQAPVNHAPMAVDDQESLDANHFSAAGEGEFMPSSRLHHPH